MNTDIGGGPSYPPFRPGFLLGPLAWLTERLSPRLGHEPELLSLLFGLEPYAMHLLGIALAHGCNERLMTLFRQAPRALVEQSISHWPEGTRSVSVHLTRNGPLPRRVSGDPTALVRQTHGKVSAAPAINRWADDRRPVRSATCPPPTGDFQSLRPVRTDGPVRAWIAISKRARRAGI